jgi:hypothetical protein
MYAFLPRSFRCVWLVLGCAAAGLLATGNAFAANKNNPSSKFYVADVEGDAQIDTGTTVDDLTKKSVYNAEGTVIETKPKAANAMVFSNGTGIFFDEDTRVEVKKFEQEPFLPNRTDMDVEPSISQTQAYVPHGTVGLCTSKLVAGSSMTYSTPLGSVNVRGGKVVIAAQNNQTTISMLEGESTVFSGDLDMGGHTLRDGEQAVITPGDTGQPPTVKIQDIPSDQRSQLDAKVTMACNSKRTVYFELRTLPNTQVTAISPLDKGGPGGFKTNTSTSDSSDVFSSSGDTQGNTGANTPSGGPGEIVAVPVAPVNLPVDFTISPASI